MAVKIQPLGDRVVVKPLEKEEKTKGGIFLPDKAKEIIKRVDNWKKSNKGAWWE